ncbi:MAG: hypothetical protein HUK09_05065 [Bacteroidaceae bacterium]|nr:hypothetical protein [Bacteroidaceae bacterium]
MLNSEGGFLGLGGAEEMKCGRFLVENRRIFFAPSDLVQISWEVFSKTWEVVLISWEKNSKTRDFFRDLGCDFWLIWDKTTHFLAFYGQNAPDFAIFALSVNCFFRARWSLRGARVGF